jgi:hypothetical protein
MWCWAQDFIFLRNTTGYILLVYKNMSNRFMNELFQHKHICVTTHFLYLIESLRIVLFQISVLLSKCNISNTIH